MYLHGPNPPPHMMGGPIARTICIIGRGEEVGEFTEYLMAMPPDCTRDPNERIDYMKLAMEEMEKKKNAKNLLGEAKKEEGAPEGEEAPESEKEEAPQGEEASQDDAPKEEAPQEEAPKEEAKEEL